MLHQVLLHFERGVAAGHGALEGPLALARVHGLEVAIQSPPGLERRLARVAHVRPLARVCAHVGLKVLGHEEGPRASGLSALEGPLARVRLPDVSKPLGRVLEGLAAVVGARELSGGGLLHLLGRPQPFKYPQCFRVNGLLPLSSPVALDGGEDLLPHQDLRHGRHRELHRQDLIHRRRRSRRGCFPELPLHSERPSGRDRGQQGVELRGGADRRARPARRPVPARLRCRGLPLWRPVRRTGGRRGQGPERPVRALKRRDRARPRRIRAARVEQGRQLPAHVELAREHVPEAVEVRRLKHRAAGIRQHRRQRRRRRRRGRGQQAGQVGQQRRGDRVGRRRGLRREARRFGSQRSAGTGSGGPEAPRPGGRGREASGPARREVVVQGGGRAGRTAAAAGGAGRGAPAGAPGPPWAARAGGPGGPWAGLPPSGGHPHAPPGPPISGGAGRRLRGGGAPGRGGSWVF